MYIIYVLYEWEDKKFFHNKNNDVQYTNIYVNINYLNKRVE